MARATTALAMCLLLTSCGTKIGYNLVDRMIMWRIDGYLDLDRQQKALLKDQVKTLHQWHRVEVLPQHINQLKAVSAAIESDTLDYALVDRTTQDLIQIWQSAMAQLSPIAADVLIDLRSEQIDHLLKKLRDDIADDEEALVERTQQESTEKRQENLEDFFDKWWGSLRDDQKLRIEQTVSEVIDLSAMELQHRRQWLQKFEAALEIRHGPQADFQSQIDALFIEPEQWWSEQYRVANKANDRLRIQLTVDLAASLDAKQKDHLLDELADLTEDLQDLVED